MHDTTITSGLGGPLVGLGPIADMPDQFLDQLPIGISTCNAEGLLVRYNRRAAELWGRRPDLQGRSIRFCGAAQHYGSDGAPIRPSDLPAAEVIRTHVPVKDREIVFERPDGSRVWVSVNAAPLLGGTGEVTGVVSCITDISALKLQQQRTEEQCRALISVLNHRVKNTLATVQALASQTIRGRGIKRDVRQKFVGRLFALSRVHDLLSREGWDSADLLTVMNGVLAPYHGRIDLQGMTIRISPKAAVALSMVLHELAANAAQHGALSEISGRVAVSWTVQACKGGNHVTLNWRESDGPPVAKPARCGFGLRLVERSIAQELSGVADLAFEPAGFGCLLSFPLAAAGEPSPAQPKADALRAY